MCGEWGTRRNFRHNFPVQNVNRPPCLASPGIAWAALVKGSSAYSTKAELNSMVLGALQGWPSGLGCWDGWRHGWSAWAVVSSGAGGGRRSYAVIFCALPLSSPLSPSLPLQIVGSLGAGGGAGSGVWLGAGSAWAQAFPVPWAG